MPIILRVDVDNAYPFIGFNFLALNYYFPKIASLGYQNFLVDLVDDLNERGVKSTFFFEKKTILKDVDILKKHEIGLHLVYSTTYESFVKELFYVSMKTLTKIRGFSKHGSGTLKLARGHDWLYKSKEYEQWAVKSNLSYFSGNGENPDVAPTLKNGVTIFAGAYWLRSMYRSKEYNVDWLVNYSDNNDVVVLMHPYNWVKYPQVRKEYEAIIDRIDDFVFFPAN